MSAIKTDMKTKDNLYVYDLFPQASQFWAVAGPDGFDPQSISQFCFTNRKHLITHQIEE